MENAVAALVTCGCFSSVEFSEQWTRKAAHSVWKQLKPPINSIKNNNSNPWKYAVTTEVERRMQTGRKGCVDTAAADQMMRLRCDATVTTVLTRGPSSEKEQLKGPNNNFRWGATLTAWCASMDIILYHRSDQYKNATLSSLITFLLL